MRGLQPGNWRLRNQGLTRALTRSAIGKRAELAAADYLFACGFAILGCNIRLGPLELDVVARRSDLLVVVEVRTRGPSSYASAFQSVTRRKLARVRAATGRLWRERKVNVDGIRRVRIDVADVQFEGALTRVDYVQGVT